MILRIAFRIIWPVAASAAPGFSDARAGCILGAIMRNRHGFLAVTVLAATSFAGRARADEAAGHYNLGLQLKREGKTAEAIAEMEKAIKLRSDYAAAYLSLGNLWRAQGEYAKAATALEQAVKLQPKDALSHANLGAVYVRQKRLDQGIRELETAVS